MKALRAGEAADGDGCVMRTSSAKGFCEIYPIAESEKTLLFGRKTGRFRSVSGGLTWRLKTGLDTVCLVPKSY